VDSLKDIQILLVEDDPIIAHDISVLLKQKGAKITGVAHNYNKAMDLLINKSF